MFRGQGPTIAAVAAGGALGALARYSITIIGGGAGNGFPWHLVVVNTVGCFLIGVLLVVVNEVLTVHPIVRPFIGTGVLGGFTTFSMFAEDTVELVSAGNVLAAGAYVGFTLVGAFGGVWAAMQITRLLAPRRGSAS
ncbi:CrcB family protein [Hoyosella rhizosphaerae]|uniref:Fluoride-specific ion channel FluC n=1 Tax=Hoyosella rhizosphaerae TaxID=1755582 RepID=A0A916XBY1_9ACTN|nr:CrcB family protein [Hoyosella rhizosphaerae]MBN4927666.1 CrcB family protein [Hoyosella rhizosphaerae]GGC62656.1 putative fluoride ion transporter CrcB 1 [Hoyosella rhizosphaerae]